MVSVKAIAILHMNEEHGNMHEETISAAFTSAELGQIHGDNSRNT